MNGGYVRPLAEAQPSTRNGSGRQCGGGRSAPEDRRAERLRLAHQASELAQDRLTLYLI